MLFGKKEEQNVKPLENDNSFRLAELKEEYDKYLQSLPDDAIKIEMVDSFNKDDIGIYLLEETDSRYICYPLPIQNDEKIEFAGRYEYALERCKRILYLDKAKFKIDNGGISIEKQSEYRSIIKTTENTFAITDGNERYSFSKKDPEDLLKHLKSLANTNDDVSNPSNLIISNDALEVQVKYDAKKYYENRIMWRDKKNLYLLKVKDNNIVDIFSIPVSHIKYYKADGDLKRDCFISGGGGKGGGVNYKGAAIGGLLFGGAGAVIGSRVNTDIEIEEIKTEIVEVDTRIVYLVVENDNGQYSQFVFDYSALAAMEWFLPDKEYRYVIEKRRAEFEA